MKKSFKQRVAAFDGHCTTFDRLETVQVNLGDLCNMSCVHCHQNASPRGARIMRRDVMDKIALFMASHPGLTLDITGGCPEMNPDFRYFVEITAGLAERRIIRSNLTIALEQGMDWLPDFYSKHQLVVMASLPCYEQENVDKQRGNGAFSHSIEALRLLNRHGYGKGLELHLVYNPNGTAVAGGRDLLEQYYRRELLQRFGISFNRLHCMNNVPLGRYRKHLEKNGTYRSYIEYLTENFNTKAVDQIMCRTLINVGWDGTLYNCDFNLAAGLPLQREDKAVMDIIHINEVIVSGSPILMSDHCFSCTAGFGSGCGGSSSDSDSSKGVPSADNSRGISKCYLQ